MQTWRKVRLQSNRSKQGFLVIAEVGKVTGGEFTSSPRSYFIFNDTQYEDVRKGHWHPFGKQEVLICLSGSAKVELHADGGCDTVTFDSPDEALVIPSGTWHEVRLSPGAILAIIASTVYVSDESLTTRLPCRCGG